MNIRFFLISHENLLPAVTGPCIYGKVYFLEESMRKKYIAIALLVAFTSVASFLAGQILAVPQPRMENALKDLQSAKQSLQNAEHNKGGHRAAAIELINQAIQHVREGIEAGNH